MSPWINVFEKPFCFLFVIMKVVFVIVIYSDPYYGKITFLGAKKKERLGWQKYKGKGECIILEQKHFKNCTCGKMCVWISGAKHYVGIFSLFGALCPEFIYLYFGGCTCFFFWELFFRAIHVLCLKAYGNWAWELLQNYLKACLHFLSNSPSWKNISLNLAICR